MQNRTIAKPSFRNGMTIEQARMDIARRRVNAAIAHAGWAGRHIANLLTFESRQNSNTAYSMTFATQWMEEMLSQKYLVEPELLKYAIHVARRKV